MMQWCKWLLHIFYNSGLDVTHNRVPIYIAHHVSVGGVARRKLCCVKSVVSKHDMVVLLAAVSAHLFELTEGSIPSASCG